MNGRVLWNARLAMLDQPQPEGLVERGAVVIDGETIAWAGACDAMPARFAAWQREDMDGRLVTPAPIDCHTHVVYGGDRAAEFEQRLEGVSYEAIARAGGGIGATVAATRAADDDTLLEGALRCVDDLLAEGVSTIEVKSGYGLDVPTEVRMLTIARKLPALRPLRVRTTFLGAHAVAPEYRQDPDAYLTDVCIPALRAAHAQGLVDAVDGFCEGIAFSPDQIARVFDVARELGLPVKLHAEQLSHTGGTMLAARFGALSADHLEYATADDAAAMAASGTVAVLLPGAFYTLRETSLPPVAAFREHGVPMALATDCNPGSSPLSSILLAMNMGCTLFRLTPREALAGVTVHAARALGLSDTGLIRAGLRADLAVWNVAQPAELAYRIGRNPLARRVFAGRDAGIGAMT